VLTRGERHHFVYQKGDAQQARSTSENETKKEGFSYFGSKGGAVYYYAWCKAGKRIKEEKRVYFATEEKAKDAGRTLSKLCE
jgi:hypothetical protein